MIDLGKLLHVQGAVLWLPCTILLFSASSTLYQRLRTANDQILGCQSALEGGERLKTGD